MFEGCSPGRREVLGSQSRGILRLKWKGGSELYWVQKVCRGRARNFKSMRPSFYRHMKGGLWPPDAPPSFTTGGKKNTGRF